MYLVVGLGNPEYRYKGTRHNIGFEVINKYSYDNNVEINRLKCQAYTGIFTKFSKKIILVKPQTFMNLSGDSVIELLKFYKVPMDKLIVIYDELDLPLGDIRIKLKGSPAGHNGLKNIIYNLKSDEFKRIRVGIGPRPGRGYIADYVISTFLEKEFNDMVRGVTLATEAIDMILDRGALKAMNLYNTKS
jgi:PTH1 family peptidyl-tRNA hydrolase